MGKKEIHIKQKRRQDTGLQQTNLIYVSPGALCIQRKKRGRGFEYFNKNKKITDEKIIKRITSLVIPPAWTCVAICHMENGHLQATGYDQKHRKQYLYHPLWIKMRQKTKFDRLYLFGKKLPYLRRKIKQDLRQKNLSERKVLATLLTIMEETNIRIGSGLYNKLYGSYGLSTFRDRHVALNGCQLRFRFVGKKGKSHDISIRDKRLASIVRNCKEIPGKQLFQFYDENGARHSVHSEDVNNYIKDLSGASFTSKDFRTWAGTVDAVSAIRRRIRENGKMPYSEMVTETIDEVASHLGNTRAVCKKYYIHPAIFKALEEGLLEKLSRQIKVPCKWLDRDERIAMKILKLKQA